MTERAILRARLAAPRAELLWQLLGIPESILSAKPVADTLTTTDLLARIAHRDNHAAARIEQLLAGKNPVNASSAPAESMPDPDLAQTAGQPLSETLDSLLHARSAFLSALARIPDTDTTAADVMHKQARAICEDRIEQDAACAVMIADWPLRSRTGRTHGPATLLVAAMRAARKELLTSLAVLPPEERESRPIRQAQTLLDILASLTDRETSALRAVLRLEARGSNSGPNTGSGAQAQHNASWQSVWTRLHTTHQALLQALAALDERELNQDLAIGDPGFTIYAVMCDCIARDRDQAAAIRKLLHI